MSSVVTTLSSIVSRLIHADLIALLRETLPLLDDLRKKLRKRRLQGMYEVLDQTRTITIHDPRGRVVTVDTVSRLRFLQDHIAALTDYVWGDGEIMAEYRCSPGVPVDCYKEGSRHAVLISLREHKHHGDEMVLRTHREIRGGFTRSEECWESDVYHRTRRIEIIVIFPRERPCKKATASRRNACETAALGPEQFSTLPDGRQQVRCVIKKPKLHERYVLRWVW